ncbi:MAG: hypothetical protein K0U63_01810 [Cyanobacteria bacterium]|jgi:hypothetical protein|nr:hypothetical protein [Cyanobacteriota bacterium]
MPSALKRRVLLRQQRLVSFWIVALAVELLWQAALEISPSLAVQLSVLHLVVGLDLMLLLLWGLVNALAEEPVFNSDLLMGAAFASVAITIVGQLYGAIMIAGVLGKPRQPPTAAPGSAHPQAPNAADPSKILRLRR